MTKPIRPVVTSAPGRNFSRAPPPTPMPPPPDAASASCGAHATGRPPLVLLRGGQSRPPGWRLLRNAKHHLLPPYDKLWFHLAGRFLSGRLQCKAKHRAKMSGNSGAASACGRGREARGARGTLARAGPHALPPTVNPRRVTQPFAVFPNPFPHPVRARRRSGSPRDPAGPPQQGRGRTRGS